MQNHTFYLVDVFAEKKYAGNQLAVITGAESFSDKQMQEIANEMHFSETAFIYPKNQKTKAFTIRIFTPKTEVPFAGHPILGTAYIIKNFLTKYKNQKVTLNLTAGSITVIFEEQDGKEILWMKQLPPVFGKRYQISQFRSLLGLKTCDFDNKYPIQQISTGLPFIIVPLKSLGSVKRAKINQSMLQQFVKQTPAGILIFAQKTYREDNQLNVRVFVDAFGIPEDPATGSGNGCLAAYLSLNQYFGGPEVNIKVEQGFEIRRPSILHLKAEKDCGVTQVYVGGQVALIAKGRLF